MYADEFRRCLIEVDVPGIVRIWRHVAPHLADANPDHALISLHMARVEAKSVPLRLRLYSAALLKERGFERDENGRWSWGPVLDQPVIVEAVGIASKSSIPGLAKQIVGVMKDALEDVRDKGELDPNAQRGAMLAARRRFKFRFNH